jgi:hypothetical protein
MEISRVNKTTYDNRERTEDSKIPGPFMRSVIRLQAALNLIAALVIPIVIIKGITRGKIKLSFNDYRRTVELGTAAKCIGAGIAGAGATVYSAINAVSRIRVASDAATQEKINQGKLSAEQAPLKSGRLDVIMTRINAGLAGASIVAIGAIALNDLRKPGIPG